MLGVTDKYVYFSEYFENIAQEYQLRQTQAFDINTMTLSFDTMNKQSL